MLDCSSKARRDTGLVAARARRPLLRIVRDDTVAEGSEETMRSTLEGLLLSALALGLAGCRTGTTFSTDSVAPSQPIIIDGSTDEWRGNLFVEGERLEIGFFNDREDLYVCLLTKDNLVRAEILTEGLTVWFDPRGGTEEVFGIRFPLGLPPGEQKLALKGTPEGPKLEDLPKVAMTELEILREKEPPQRMPVAEARGIEVKVLPTSERIVYELKIPLGVTKQHRFAVGAEPGKTIGVGFESPKLELSQMPRRRSGERPRTGGEPGAGGEEPGEGGAEADERGMHGHGGGFRRPEAMKIWASVRLAP
jgi:hypothetical protein